MAPLDVLVLQHIACEPPGVYEDVLLERGAAIERIQLDEGGELPSRRDFDAVIAMGGPMGAYEDDVHRWLAAEKHFLANALQVGTPVWGVCLGVQLLAASLGARVFAGPRPEVGLLPVELTAEGRDDVVFADLPDGLATLQWHGDTFELPPGAIRLAGSASYLNQAFRVGTTYGVQFHLEVTPAMAREWASVPAYAASLEQVLGARAATAFLESIETRAGEMLAHGRALFERWLDHVVEPAAERSRPSATRS